MVQKEDTSEYEGQRRQINDRRHKGQNNQQPTNLRNDRLESNISSVKYILCLKSITETRHPRATLLILIPVQQYYQHKNNTAHHSYALHQVLLMCRTYSKRGIYRYKLLSCCSRLLAYWHRISKRKENESRRLGGWRGLVFVEVSPSSWPRVRLKEVAR